MTSVHIVWVEVGLWEQEKLHGIGNFYTLQRSHDSWIFNTCWYNDHNAFKFDIKD